MEEINDIIKEFEARVKSIPVATIKDPKKFADYYVENGLTPSELNSIGLYVAMQVPDFDDVSIVGKPQGKDVLTFGDFLEWRDKVYAEFIVIIRVNYFVRRAMITVFDLLEKENRLKFMVRKRYLQAEYEWEKYEGPRRKSLDMATWSTLDDSLNISYSMLSPYLESLYASVRDYMIRLGWRDIELKAWILISLLLCKVSRHSFNVFFQDFADACGCDFSKCFSYAEMGAMEQRFAQMCDALGVKTVKDKFGFYELQGFDFEQAIRVQWAWNRFMKSLRDNELMDEAAERAIGLNPTFEAGYKKAIAEAEEKQMEKDAERLSEKFKVKRFRKTRVHSKAK